MPHYCINMLKLTKQSAFKFSRIRLLSTETSSTANKILIYGFPLSQPTRSLLLLCHANAIPYELKIVDALKGENRKQDFLKIHPAGLIPAITDGSFTLGESAAILQYLAESRNLNTWYPRNDPVARAKINFWLHWHHDNSRKATKEILINQLFTMKGGEEKLNAGVKALAKSVQFLEKHLSGINGPAVTYLAGDTPTIADLLIITELDQLSSSAFNSFDFTKYPHVSNWMKRLQLLPDYDKIFAGVVDAAKKYVKK